MAEKLARPSLVDRAHLAVEHRVRRADRAGQRTRHRREALGQVVVAPAQELHLAAAQVGERAVAVPLDLVQPALLRRNLLGERRQHRLVALRRRLVRRPCGRGASSSPGRRASRERASTGPGAARRRAARSGRRRASPRPARSGPSPRSRPCRRRTAPSGSRRRTSRTRAGGPRRARRGGAARSRAERPSERPSLRARRLAPDGSRSAAREPGGAGRRRLDGSPASPCRRTAQASCGGRACVRSR